MGRHLILMKPQPSVEQLATHINQLLARFSIDHRIVSLDAPLKWMAVHADRRAEFPRVRSAASYLIALHEIGHFVVLSRRGQLLNEAAVWIWMRDTAIIWKPEFDEIMAVCFSRYTGAIEVSKKIKSLLS